MSTPPAEQSASPGGQPSPFATKGFIFGATIVAVVLVMLAWLLLSPTPSDTRQPPASQPPAAGPASEPVSDSVCGLTAGDQTPPVVTPESTWQLVGLMAAPTDPAIGPGQTGPGWVPVCYAPDAMGALYAAANFVAVSSDPNLRMAAATELTATGAGQEAMVRDLERSIGGRSTGIRTVAFSFVGYDPARSASIDLVLDSGTVMGHVELYLLWEDGDWKVQVPVTGDPLAGLQQLATTAGYVAWAGQ